MNMPKVMAGVAIVVAVLLVPAIWPASRANYPPAEDLIRAGQDRPALDDAELDRIREAVVRYQVAHLVPNDISPAAAPKLIGYCVGLDRAGGKDPSPALLSRLKDLPLPVASYASCAKDDMRGRIPLWVVSISPSSVDAVQVVGRASQNSYVYALEKRQGVWTVTAAKLTGRS